MDRERDCKNENETGPEAVPKKGSAKLRKKEIEKNPINIKKEKQTKSNHREQ